MKKRIHLITKMAYVVVATLFITSCQDLDMPPFGDYEIDPSIVTINYPLEGAAIKVYEDPASIDIEFEVHDDHLVSEISIAINGTEIANLTDFVDPRNIIETVTYNGLVIGEYVLTVTSTDVNGTSTSTEVNFTKEPPYTPLFDGEILYMPFDGDFQEQVTGNIAAKVGTPGFAGSGYASANAYKGATDSYLTFPSAGLTEGNEFSATFWLKIDASDDRAGIINIAPANPAGPADKTSGFGLIREGSATAQKFILLVGNGTGTSWVNPGDPATIDPRLVEWVHFGITISETTASLYIDGELVGQSDSGFTGIDWTGVGDLVIMSGDPNFNGWNHKTEKGQMDELRIFNKALTAEDIQNMAGPSIPYIPQYPGETFYMPFEGNYVNLLGNMAATQVGSPQITIDSHEGSGAYLGDSDSYLTYPITDLFTNEFSGSFWYKVNANPDRAGILTVAPPMNGADNDLSSGFRLFREGSGTEQRIKLHVGAGAGMDVWNDGDVINVTAGEWVHIAFTVSATETKIYFNGVAATNTGDMTGKTISWANCTNLSIASGAPGFIGWGHLSDNSAIDELRLFNKALSVEEVGSIYGGEVYFGSTLYIPFESNNVDRVTNANPTIVGSPGFSGEGAVGSDAYLGATDSYLTIPINGLFANEFSGAFWYKVNANPDRAGILTVAPPMNGADNDLSSGFRLFREGSGTEQRIKLHLGTDGGDVWNDGDVINVTAGEWVHIAFTVSATETKIYFNGAAATNTGNMTGKTISWSNCTDLSIASGAPGFIGWGHLSDLSEIDELYLFDKTLTQSEIQAIMSQ